MSTPHATNEPPKPPSGLRKLLANLSIRSKIVLIILISTLTSLSTGFVLVLNATTNSYKNELEDQTQLIAKVLADYSEISLEFNVKDLAGDDLDQILRSVPDIANACVYGDYEETGIYLATCTKDTEEPQPPGELADGEVLIHDGFVYAREPVVSHDDEEGPKKLGWVVLQVRTDVVDQQIRKHIRSMIGLLAILVAVAIVFAYYLQRFISQPILDLAQQALHISQDADYSVRVSKPGNDEIGLLYDGFNDMLTQIQRRQEELERSNRDLDQFAHVASHDLKAPLRAISTLSGWIEEDLGDRLSEEGQEQMMLLRSRVRRMDALIDGILRYARVGRSSAHDEQVDVEQLLHGVIELVVPPPGMEIVIGEGMPALVTTRLRLEQIFSNLINNAIKYHHREQGRIEIHCQRDGDFYRFSVADDGPGIAPEHHERIFRMFQTLQPREKVESTGLGLALVKRLVEEEGGTICVESRPGEGARFVFTWPAVRLSPSTTRPG